MIKIYIRIVVCILIEINTFLLLHFQRKLSLQHFFIENVCSNDNTTDQLNFWRAFVSNLDRELSILTKVTLVYPISSRPISDSNCIMPLKLFPKFFPIHNYPAILPTSIKILSRTKFSSHFFLRCCVFFT
jgi:hypothetical protein